MLAREKIDLLALMSGVRRVLAESQDYESTLSAIAHLVLPHLGSWCAVDVCEEDGTIRRLAVIHPDPAKAHLAKALEKGWPPEVDDSVGAPAVMRTRRTISIPHVTDELLREVARTPENLRTLLALGIGSVITVPLIARNSVLGAITFVSDAAGLDYNTSDIVLAEDLAGIAALALDNARLYGDAIGRAKVESANRAKSDFLSTMSHEIRTPLNAILGYAELLELELAGSLNAQQREFVVRLRLSGTHLADLVNDVLDLAKADAGKLLMDGETASTAAAVATAIAATQLSADAAKVRLLDESASGSGEGVAYVGDEKRVRQIIINLLANALKFTPPGGTVTLSCGTVAECPAGARLGGVGPWAFIRVVDTGPGVAANRQIAIFEPFVQGESGLTRSKGGTGLGLTISRRLARLMGGDLTLESQSLSPVAVTGASFTLWLPSTNEAREEPWSGVGELAGPRIAVVLETGSDYRELGLAEIGRHIRGHIEDVLRGIASRLRTDPAFPFSESHAASEVENHQLAFLVEVVQSLVVLDETGGVDSDLFRHGSEIQRLVSALHGAMRHQQGWTLEQLAREAAIVNEELAALIHRLVPDGMGDVTRALAVIEHLVEQSRVVSAQAFRRAERRSMAVLA